MSYAEITSHNIPSGEMPEPSQDLRDGSNPEDLSTFNADQKINILPAGSDPNHPDIVIESAAPPAPVISHPPAEPNPSTSDVAPVPLPAPAKGDVSIPESGAQWENEKAKIKKDIEGDVSKAKKLGKKYENKAKYEIGRAESALAPYWEKTKNIVLRPATLGGLVGVVNVGLLGFLGYNAYNNYQRPWNPRSIAIPAAGILALFGAEGLLADSYLETPEGRAEAERAKEEGSHLYKQAKEIVLRPAVAGGLVGAFNVALLSTIGYFSYTNWSKPWDRRIVSAISVGLIGLSGLEGWAGKVYADKELPKH